MSKTYSASYSDVTLANPAYNPVYVTGTITGTASALEGVGPTFWTVGNSGLISASGGATTAGIRLDAGGVVANQASGTISGYVAVGVYGRGTVTNAGTLTGTSRGIEVTGGGTAVNQSGGYIGAPGGTGILVDSATGTAGYAANLSGGIIVAGANGMIGTGVSGGVLALVNLGAVTAETGYGLYATNTGGVTNAAGGTVVAGIDGLRINNGYPTVPDVAVNAGAITASRHGFFLSGGGVTGINATGGYVKPLDDCVVIYGGGSFTNQSGGTLNAGRHGVFFNFGTGTVLNQGAITATNRGIWLENGGSVTNAAGGVIYAYSFGVLNTVDAMTVANAGTIIATAASAAYAVLLSAGYAERLIVDPGAVFIGTVSGGNTIGSTAVSALELASGATAGTLSGLGSQFVNFSQAAVDAGAAWTLTGSNTIAIGETFTDNGTLANTGTITGGITLGSGASLSNLGGTIAQSGGTALYSYAAGVSVTNTGVIRESAGAFSAISIYGNVSNAAGATISGWRGAHLTGVAGTLFNAGVIAGTGTTQGAAVVLSSGGAVSNATTGTISSSYGSAVYVTGTSGTVINAGDIFNPGANGVGIELTSGGTISNAASGTISSTSHDAIYIIGGSGTILNAGLITDAGSAGADIALLIGGLVSNAATGRITSLQRTAVYVTGSAGTLVNAGLIQSSGSHTAIVLEVGGSVTNQAGASIYGGSSHSGVYITGSSGTVINDGLLAGGSVSGVHLHRGGGVTNQASGTITANASNHAAIYVTGAAGGVVNAGLINALSMLQGGSVTNQAGGIIATIGTITGVFINGASSEVVNAGSIGGGGGVGLLVGGYVTNAVTGVITATQGAGVAISGGAATVMNSGKIISNGGTAVGVGVNAGGVVGNAASGTIVGATGIHFGGGAGTLVDAGTVTGTAGVAVSFSPGFTNQLIVDPGAVFNGSVNGGNLVGATVVSTMELASSASAGTLTGLGSQHVHFANITIDSGAAWTLASAALGAGYTIIDAGRLTNAGSLGSTVMLAAGAQLTNAPGAIISASSVAVTGATSGQVVNQGTIVGVGGVEVGAGSTVTNAAGALITAGTMNGVEIIGGGSLFNAGSIGNAGIDFSAVYFHGSGTLYNAATGTITATYRDIDVFGGSGTVVNLGLLTSSNTAQSAIALENGGGITNAAGGTILAAYHDIYIKGGGTVLNAGMIAATGANTIAVGMLAGNTNRLIVAPGAAFVGNVDGGNTIGATATSYLELASAGSTGTLSGLGTQFIDFAQVTLDAGAKWDVQGAVPSGETIQLANGAYLQLANPGSVAGSVVNFAAGETIDLKGVNPSSVSFASGTLSFGGGSFALALSGAGGVAASASTDGAAVVTCFRAGTRIATVRGEIAVEHLAIGDRVHSLPLPSASQMEERERRARDEVSWIGHRHIDCTQHPKPHLVWPVRVMHGAFGDGLPHRDLWLSPDHAIYVNGVLIPVKYLINRTTIVQVPVADVTYFHVELPHHAVLLAEGLPVESYLETGDRANFDNGGAPIRLHPEFASRAWEAHGCVPLVMAGPALEAARATLDPIALSLRSAA